MRKAKCEAAELKECVCLYLKLERGCTQFASVEYVGVYFIPSILLFYAHIYLNTIIIDSVLSICRPSRVQGKPDVVLPIILLFLGSYLVYI